MYKVPWSLCVYDMLCVAAIFDYRATDLCYKAIVEDFRWKFLKPGLEYSENVMKLILLFSFTEHPTQCFFVKEYFPVRHLVAINVKTGMPPFGILANHNIKMCHNSMKKIMIQKITQNNWNFWTVDLIMRAKNC